MRSRSDVRRREQRCSRGRRGDHHSGLLQCLLEHFPLLIRGNIPRQHPSLELNSLMHRIGTQSVDQGRQPCIDRAIEDRAMDDSGVVAEKEGDVGRNLCPGANSDETAWRRMRRDKEAGRE